MSEIAGKWLAVVGVTAGSLDKHLQGQVCFVLEFVFFDLLRPVDSGFDTLSTDKLTWGRLLTNRGDI